MVIEKPAWFCDHPLCIPIDHLVIIAKIFFSPQKFPTIFFSELNQLTGLAAILRFPMQELVHYEWLLKWFCDHSLCIPISPLMIFAKSKYSVLKIDYFFPQYLCRTQPVDGPGRPPPLSNAGHRGRRQLRLGRRLKQELVHLRNLYLLLTLPVLSAKKLL